MRTRDEFPAFLTAHGLTKHCVEVGTYKGVFAKQILEGWPGHLTCVDAWQHFHGNPDILNHPQHDMDVCYEETQRTLAPFGARCTIIRALSVDAADVFATVGTQFDAVYLDAGHNKENIEADIDVWWPRVRAGGVLSGHDYLDGLASHGYPADFAVKSAVNAFAKQQGLQVHITTDDPSPTWWVFKEAE